MFFISDNSGYAILPKQHCMASSFMEFLDPVHDCDVYLREMIPNANGNPLPTQYNLCCTCIGKYRFIYFDIVLPGRMRIIPDSWFKTYCVSELCILLLVNSKYRSGGNKRIRDASI